MMPICEFLCWTDEKFGSKSGAGTSICSSRLVTFAGRRMKMSSALMMATLLGNRPLHSLQEKARPKCPPPDLRIASSLQSVR